MFISLYLEQSKHIKKHQQKIPSTGCNVIEFFRVPLYIVFLFDHQEKFLVALTYDTNSEKQIWNFYYWLFLSYADNRSTHTYRDQPRKM